MSRTERLLSLIQFMRRHRRPVPGRLIAAELGISMRTLYRDIATLQGQGASIEGEAGLGYVLSEGFMLPPLMLTAEETEALVLGARWVASRGDGSLTVSARDLLAKIGAVLPADLRRDLEASTMLIGPAKGREADRVDLGALRRLIRAEHRIEIDYSDGEDRMSTRVVWPFALGYFETSRILVAWCKERQDFRHFRTERIARLSDTGDRYPRRRTALLKAWRQSQNIPEPPAAGF